CSGLRPNCGTLSRADCAPSLALLCAARITTGLTPPGQAARVRAPIVCGSHEPSLCLAARWLCCTCATIGRFHAWRHALQWGGGGGGAQRTGGTTRTSR